MASLQKIYTQPKLLGQIYTPYYIVEKILEDIGYNTADVLKKCIIDPACGDGRFLQIIVERIIKWSKKENIKQNLSYVYGWDIDEIAIIECRDNLNKLIEPLGITVNWNLSVCDSLEKIENLYSIFGNETIQKFDFIVGNPPYIRIQHLEEYQRKFIQRHFNFCKSGSTDIYIAFFELAYHLLKENGSCAFITPNTFFYTETGSECRTFLAKNKNVLKITNYGDIQLFNNATTYSAITIFSKRKQQNFIFEKAETETTFLNRKIDFNEIAGKKLWQLSIEESQQTNEKTVPLKDICKIHVGLTTLCDKGYIFSITENDENTVLANTKLMGLQRIEKGILKPIIKGSTLKNGVHEIKEYILFPYEKVNGKHQIMAENDLKEKYPYAYAYLLSIKNILDLRDNGAKNTIAWYAFGRSQGLETSFGKKIIFSPMNLKPNFIYSSDERSTLYSGYCIKYNGDVENLLAQLNSEKMQKFIAISSRDFRGGWKAYSKKTIEDFPIVL